MSVPKTGFVPDKPVSAQTRRFSLRWQTLVVALLFSLHAGLLAWTALKDSPTWDEVGHLASGLSHWTTGRFTLYRVNPPLVRLVAALPVLCVDHGVESSPVVDGSGVRMETTVGAHFAERAGSRLFLWMTLARWACIPFSLLGGYICFRWSREQYGNSASLLALSLWTFSPTVLAYGHLIAPDIGAASFGILSAYCFHRWLQSPSWTTMLLAGFSLGLAELTKLTWLVFFGLWPVLWLIWRLSAGGSRARWPRACVSSAPMAAPTTQYSWLRDIGQLSIILALGLYIINAAYCFEGSLSRLGDYGFASEMLGGVRNEATRYSIAGRNRFANTWLGDFPLPLPSSYVLGIDRQRLEFEDKLPSYLRGEWRKGGWWYYYVYSLAIKEPVGTWLLFFLSVGVTLFVKAAKQGSADDEGKVSSSAGEAGGSLVQRSNDASLGVSRIGHGYAARWQDELMLLAPAAAVLFLVSSQTGFNHHVRYVLPCLPFLFISISKVAQSIEFRHWRTAAIAVGLLLWSVGSSLYCFPHSLSYFNELVGGPLGGHFHLANSNVDWGQDLLYLSQWYESHPDARPLYLAYDMPFVDPHIVGIKWQPVPAGPVMNRPGAPVAGDWPWLVKSESDGASKASDTVKQTMDEDAGPQAGWFVVSVNQIHREEGDLEYFLEFHPITTIGYSLYVYHIRLDDANRVRRKLGLPKLAQEEIETANQSVRR